MEESMNEGVSGVDESPITVKDPCLVEKSELTKMMDVMMEMLNKWDKKEEQAELTRQEEKHRQLEEEHRRQKEKEERDRMWEIRMEQSRRDWQEMINLMKLRAKGTKQDIIEGKVTNKIEVEVAEVAQSIETEHTENKDQAIDLVKCTASEMKEQIGELKIEIEEEIEGEINEDEVECQLVQHRQEIEIVKEEVEETKKIAVSSTKQSVSVRGRVIKLGKSRKRKCKLKGRKGGKSKIKFKEKGKCKYKNNDKRKLNEEDRKKAKNKNIENWIKQIEEVRKQMLSKIRELLKKGRIKVRIRVRQGKNKKRKAGGGDRKRDRLKQHKHKRRKTSKGYTKVDRRGERGHHRKARKRPKYQSDILSCRGKNKTKREIDKIENSNRANDVQIITTTSIMIFRKRPPDRN